MHTVGVSIFLGIIRFNDFGDETNAEENLTVALGLLTFVTNYIIIYAFILFLGKLKLAELQFRSAIENISVERTLQKLKKY